MSQQLALGCETEANEGDLRSSPSPRQANVSLSFSSMGSCPLDYSDDVSLIYPVSPASSDFNDVKNESPSSDSTSKLGVAQTEGDEEITSKNVETEVLTKVTRTRR